MANYTLQSHGGEGLYMTADGTPTARRNVYIKARVSDSLDQTWRIDSPSNGARTRIFSCKSNNTGGYALNNATGTNNCDIISHISERGGSPLCGDKPSAERTRPQGCISAPLVPKGFIRRSRFRLVFSDIPVLVHSSVQAGEARQLPRRSWSLLPAQCFQRLRPGR